MRLIFALQRFTEEHTEVPLLVSTYSQPSFTSPHLMKIAIKTFNQIKLNEADEQTPGEIRDEAQMMEKLGLFSPPPSSLPRYLLHHIYLIRTSSKCDLLCGSNHKSQFERSSSPFQSGDPLLQEWISV